MKAILLSAAALAVYTILITLLFRAKPVRERAGMMVAIYLLTFPLFIAIYLHSPAHLWVLPTWLAAADWRADLLFAMLVYIAGFFGGVLQLYNLADRGFSLRILIDIEEAPDRKLDVDGVMSSYSAGQGIEWMYRKRLDDMISRHLVVADADAVVLTQRGSGVAKVFSKLRQALRLEEDRSRVS